MAGNKGSSTGGPGGYVEEPTAVSDKDGNIDVEGGLPPGQQPSYVGDREGQVPPKGNDPGTPEPPLMPAPDTGGPNEGANANFAGGNYDPAAVRAAAINRKVQQEELSQYQLEKMLASNSPLMRQAAEMGLARGGSRGLMNSSLATGAAQGAMISGAQPFALQDSSWYGQTASENMAATNEASNLNAQLGTQANIAGAENSLKRDSQLADQEWKWDEMRQEEAWKTSEAEAGRSWQTGERLGTEEHTAAQNALNRAWTSNENMESNMLKWQLGKLEAAKALGISRAQAWADMYSSIMNNPNPKFKADERNAAIVRLQADLDEQYGEDSADDYETSWEPGQGANENYNPGPILWKYDTYGNLVPYNGPQFYATEQAANDADENLPNN